MFDLQSVIEDFIPPGSCLDVQAITLQVQNLIMQYTDILDMLYIIDIQDPTREEQELSYNIQLAMYELRFLIFQLFNQDMTIPIFDINEQHLAKYIPFIFYMSRLNKLRLDAK